MFQEVKYIHAHTIFYVYLTKCEGREDTSSMLETTELQTAERETAQMKTGELEIARRGHQRRE